MSDGRKRRRAARRRRVCHACMFICVIRVNCIVLQMTLFSYCSCTYAVLRRSKYVVSTAEREKWQQIDSRYMTDEYSSDEDSGLSVHHPTWRSVGKLQWPSPMSVCMT